MLVEVPQEVVPDRRHGARRSVDLLGLDHPHERLRPGGTGRACTSSARPSRPRRAGPTRWRGTSARSAAPGRRPSRPHDVAHARPPWSAGRPSGGCRRRPWGCRWCRRCSTSRRRPARRRRASRRRRAAAASSVLVPSDLAPAAPRPTRSASAASGPATRTWCTVVEGAAAAARTARQQGVVDDDDLVLGVVGDVDQLLGEQPDVERVQHRAHRRDREVGLEVLGVVPHEGRDPLVAVDAEVAQALVSRAARSAPTSAYVRRRAPPVGRGDDLGVGVDRRAVLEEARRSSGGRPAWCSSRWLPVLGGSATRPSCSGTGDGAPAGPAPVPMLAP